MDVREFCFNCGGDPRMVFNFILVPISGAYVARFCLCDRCAGNEAALKGIENYLSKAISDIVRPQKDRP